MKYRAIALIAASLALPAALLPASSWAQPADPQQLFVDGQQRFDAKDFAGALPMFEQAYAATQSPNAHLYMARCLRELGRTAEAYDAMYATTREATTKAETDPKYVQTRDAAAAELALLEPKVGKLVLVWSGAAKGLAITVDGKPLGADKLGTAITMQVGKHEIVVTPEGGAAVRADAQIDGGQTKTVTLGSQPQSDGEPNAPAEGGAEPSGGGVRIGGYVVTALGVGGMVLFAVGGSLAKGQFATLEDECGTTRCTDPSYGDVVDKGKTWELVANVSLGVGIAGVVAGVAMIVFGGPSEPDEAPGSADAATALRVAPELQSVPGGGLIGLRGAF